MTINHNIPSNCHCIRRCRCSCFLWRNLEEKVHKLLINLYSIGMASEGIITIQWANEWRAANFGNLRREMSTCCDATGMQLVLRYTYSKSIQTLIYAGFLLSYNWLMKILLICVGWRVSRDAHEKNDYDRNICGIEKFRLITPDCRLFSDCSSVLFCCWFFCCCMQQANAQT